MKIAIYPGSFDPVTLGHLDVIERAAALFDRLIVVVMHNQTKKPMFTPEERQAFLRRVTSHLDNVEVDMFGGLLAEYARQRGACTIVKGLRAVSDFESEFQMALANRKLNPDLDTAFLMTERRVYVSLVVHRQGHCRTRRRYLGLCLARACGRGTQTHEKGRLTLWQQHWKN